MSFHERFAGARRTLFLTHAVTSVPPLAFLALGSYWTAALTGSLTLASFAYLYYVMRRVERALAAAALRQLLSDVHGS